LKSLDSFGERSDPKTWLISIARHTAIDHERKQRFFKWLPDHSLKNMKAIDKTPEEILQMNEQIKELYQTVSQLKQSYRDVLILRGIKGLSALETAQILQWSESKVNVTLHRAVKALQKKMSSELEVMINDAI
jgi:RNA polymerase sigma-70 factor (ECF subfamily)